MEKTVISKESSLMYRKINELGLSSLDRAEAFAALEASERMADGIYWVFNKLEHAAAWLSPKPGLKHQ